jgi:hypothetical protein
MRFHLVMLLIVVLVSLSMHSMASAAPQPASLAIQPIAPLEAPLQH